MKSLSKHLNPATVISCIALFVALSGAAYAAVGRNAIKTWNIGNGAVTTPKLRNGAVTTRKMRNFAVSRAKLRRLAVGPAQLGNGSVIAGKLGNGAVRSSALGGGVVTTPKLKNGGVIEEKLGGSSVGNSKLGGDSVSTGKVQNGAISAEKLNSGLLAQLVKNVSYETKASATDSFSPKEATVECSDGKVAIGGGAKIFGGTTVALTDTGPLPPNVDGKRIGWDAAASEIVADGENWHLEVYVVCAEL